MLKKKDIFLPLKIYVLIHDSGISVPLHCRTKKVICNLLSVMTFAIYEESSVCALYYLTTTMYKSNRVDRKNLAFIFVLVENTFLRIILRLTREKINKIIPRLSEIYSKVDCIKGTEFLFCTFT